MNELVLVMRMVVGGVFFTAAIGKMLAPGSTRAIIDTYELDPRLAPMVNVLPLAEVVLGAGLIFSATSRGAAIGAATLLVIFSGYLARNLLRGQKGSCNCFGRLHTSDISWRTLCRNGALAVASVWIALLSHQPGLTLVAVNLHDLSHDRWADVLVALAVFVACTRLAKTTGRTPRPISEVMRAAPPSRSTLRTGAGLSTTPYVTLNGATSSLEVIGASGARTLLVFIDPECGPCRSVVPTLRRWSSSFTRNGLYVVTRGRLDANRALLTDFPEDRVILDEGLALADRFGVVGTPSAVLLRNDDASPEAVVIGPSAIEFLLRQLADPSSHRFRRFRNRGTDDGGDPRPITIPDERSLTRRGMLTASGVGIFGLLAVAFGGRTHSAVAETAAAKSSGIQCPSCGTCVVCTPTSSTSKPLSCRPCKQTCSAHKLCSQYAERLSSYKTISSYLLAAGFVQSAQPWAIGLDQNGALASFSTITRLTSKSKVSPKAILIYTLESNGENAYAMTLDGKGQITSVIVTDANGKVAVTAMPATSPLTSRAHVSGMHLRDAPDSGGNEIVLTAASCADKCKLAYSFTLFALGLPLLALDPVGAAIAMGTFLMSNALPQGTTGSTYLQLTASIIGTADLYNAVNVGLDIAGDQFCALACNEEGLLKLRACCNYTGACFNLDTVCESHCPGGLAHPLAHCDVYANGKKISTLIPGGV